MAFGLYVHWPYCESKCPYCDFNSHVADRIDPARWIAAYRTEIARIAQETPDEVLTTIFFGGGTPSLMSVDTVAAVIDAATTAWRCSNQVEITMEANPGSVEADRFKGYRAAGVNRVSLGIQSLADQDLRMLGRKHDREEALRAIGIAQDTFDRINLDLIYARQHQTLSDWERELREAIDLGSDHLSLYQLTIEDGTVFARRHRAGKLPGLPDEDRATDMFHLTQALCEDAGFSAYEVSNHARPGAECRHNLLYWQGAGYAGIGPGAHGRLNLDGARVATEAIRDPSAWLTAVDTIGTGELPRVLLSTSDQQAETLLMGLRLAQGIELDRLRALGIELSGWRSLHDMRDSGHLVLDNTTLRTNAEGRLLLNTVLARLLDDMPAFAD